MCKEYLQTVRRWPYYGTTFYPVEQTFLDGVPRSIDLGINYSGVHVFRKGERVRYLIATLN